MPRRIVNAIAVYDAARYVGIYVGNTCILVTLLIWFWWLMSAKKPINKNPILFSKGAMPKGTAAVEFTWLLRILACTLCPCSAMLQRVKVFDWATRSKTGRWSYRVQIYRCRSRQKRHFSVQFLRPHCCATHIFVLRNANYQLTDGFHVPKYPLRCA